MEGNEVRDSFVLYRKQRRPIQKLNMKQRGELFTAIMDYVEDIEPAFEDEIVEMAFEFFRIQLDLDAAKYQEIIEKRSAAGKAGAAARQANVSKGKQTLAKVSKGKHNVDVNENVDEDVDENVHANEEQKPAAADIPTQEEVREYALGLGFDIDAKRFIEHYLKDGRLQINGEPVRDWRALVRSWWKQEQKSQDRKVTSAEVARKNNKFKNFDERTDDLDDEVARKYREQIAKWRQNNEDQP